MSLTECRLFRKQQSPISTKIQKNNTINISSYDIKDLFNPICKTKENNDNVLPPPQKNERTSNNLENNIADINIDADLLLNNLNNLLKE